MKDDVPRLVAERILSLKIDGEQDKDFAERVGLTPQLVDYYKKKGAGLDGAVRVLAAVPNLSAAWLLRGQEPQYVARTEEGEIAGQVEAERLALRLEVVERVVGGQIEPDALRVIARQGSAEAIAASLAELIGRSKKRA